jgi:uncharacterized UBP type Zn finger protein
MSCDHLEDLSPQDPSTTEGCEDCLSTGSTWVHLRMCMACGHVGCCDSSPNRHATAHFRQSAHPVIQSFEPGERWAWCYLDEAMVGDVGEGLDRSYS